jgi:hypothetical protein
MLKLLPVLSSTSLDDYRIGYQNGQPLGIEARMRGMRTHGGIPSMPASKHGAISLSKTILAGRDRSSLFRKR